MNIAMSGLNAFRTAMGTASHNIANSQTEGYSRQRVEISANLPQAKDGIFTGNGAHIESVRRITDDFTNEQIRTLSSEQQRLDSFNKLASRIDGMLAEDNTSLTPAMQSFFNSVDQLNSDPSSSTTRQLVMNEAQGLVSRFHTQFRQVSSLYDEVNSNIGQEVDEINSLTENLAKLNVSILNSGAQGSLDTPNDLLDQQERLLKDLSQHVGINVSKERNGMVSVYAGNGISLVSSDRAIPLEVGKDPSDPTKSIVLQNNININSSLSGGTLGGLFDFRNEMLDKTMNQLGRQATVLATTFNEQHRKGINLYEAPGGDFFRVDAPTVVPDYLNTGTGEVSAVLTDPTQLTSSDYQVKFTGGTDYEITRLDDSFTVTGSLPATIDGLEIKTTGSPAAGDMFLIQPTINGAKNIELSISNGSQIAAASPMRSLSNLNNIGDGAITTPQILDETNPDLRNPLNIKFTSPTDYEITDTVSGNTTTGSYTSNGDIDVNGLRIQITGSPAAGDSFTIDKNEGGSADNSNSRLLSELQLKKVVEGNATLQEGYSMIVNDVGGITRQTGIYRDAQNTLLANAEAMRDSISGVNLDEEAANLAKYQQAYQAAAQVIAISKSLFDTVLEATRR